MSVVSRQGPQRIACLSTEATEVLYRLGAEDRVVGISGYTVYPPQARREKPKISGFSTGHIDRILAVQPDLVIGFLDLQFPLLRECQAAGRTMESVQLEFSQRVRYGGVPRFETRSPTQQISVTPRAGREVGAAGERPYR